MTTLNDLIESIHLSLHSYTGLHEQVTWLTTAASADDTTLSVAAVDEVLRGVAEIESELIYVQTSSGSTLTLAPFGRGYRGSTAADHAINTQVTFDPPFPRAEIRRSINQSIASLYPTLFRIQTVDLPVEANTVGHDLPADTDRVLRVLVRVAGDPVVDNWVDHARWDFDPHSPLATGKALNLYEGLPSGSTIRVVYTGPFEEFADENETFASKGLPESYADLLTYAVTSRMVRFLDPGRLQLGAVENISRSQVVASGDAGRLANQLYAVYQSRLAEERRRLLDLTPSQSNYLPR
jgi:hypothetical protein